MNALNDDDLVFVEDEAAQSETGEDAGHWRILVVDDDPGVHEVTRFALANTLILNRPVTLFHASSGTEAVALLRAKDNIAVVLLDVVMESDDAGLRTVDIIRNELKLANCRIILRTGQPGQAPEAETITRYDINDYKTKSELTQNKLFTTLTAAIRSYDQLLRLDANRRGLEKIIAASNQFIVEQGLQTFAEGVITQIAGLMGIEPEGLVCAAVEDNPLDKSSSQLRIIAAAGQFRHLIQHRLNEIDDPRIVGALTEALEQRRNLIESRNVTLYFAKTPEKGFAAFIDSAIPIRDVDQDLLEVFCTNIALCAKNIDLVAELRSDAFFDRRLGLPNHTALVGEIDQRLAMAPDAGSVLALVDVDQFASANDWLGQDYGDALLEATAQRLRERLPSEAFIARRAGDGFAVVGPARVVNGEHVQACFRTPVAIEGVHQSVSISVGIVPLAKGRSGIEYVKDGYLALKRAKAAGQGQTMMFSEDFRRAARERAHLLRDLRLATARKQLFLTYQPQIDLKSGQIVGAEALMRWRREDGGLVPPDCFIPIAEHSGLIVGMGDWLLHTSLLALQRSRAAGFPDLRMAVNISPVQLRQPDFFEVVAEALRQTQSHPANLELDITAAVAGGGLEPVIAVLGRLRAMGVTVAFDPFGTDYSALTYLDELPADRLKVDHRLVGALEQDARAARAARTFIAVGRELGLKVVAKGVENQNLLQRVIALGCNEAQGYHYASPMLEEEFVAWLATQRRIHS